MDKDDTFMDAEAGPSGTQYASYQANEVSDGITPPQDANDEQGMLEDVEESREAQLEAEATGAVAAAAAEEESAMHEHHMRFHRPFRPPDMYSAAKRTSFTRARAKLGGQQAQAPPSFQAIYQLSGHKQCVTSIRFSPNGQWLATAGKCRKHHSWPKHSLFSSLHNLHH
jgi:hypothetical protein